jgi:hypothetical protein
VTSANALQGAVANGAPSGGTAPQGTVTLTPEQAAEVQARLEELKALKAQQ